MATVSLHFSSPSSALASLLCFLLLSGVSFAADPFVSYDFKLSYITASPLGVPQQVCLSFPRKSRVRCLNNVLAVNREILGVFWGLASDGFC